MKIQTIQLFPITVSPAMSATSQHILVWLAAEGGRPGLAGRAATSPGAAA